MEQCAFAFVVKGGDGEHTAPMMKLNNGFTARNAANSADIARAGSYRDRQTGEASLPVQSCREKHHAAPFSIRRHTSFNYLVRNSRSCSFCSLQACYPSDEVRLGPALFFPGPLPHAAADPHRVVSAFNSSSHGRSNSLFGDSLAIRAGGD
jgi:hypothetical protein